MHGLNFRFDYSHSSIGLKEVSRLILDVFEIDLSPLDRLGHDPSVVTFGYWDGDCLIANVSLYQRRLWLAGEQVTAFGVRSVATRPEWRSKGIFRDLMHRALAYADQRSSLIILETDFPDLYRPFGFRQIEEAYFTSSAMPGKSDSRSVELSLDREGDVDLLRSIFARRAPTSFVASACDHPALFLLKAKLTPEIRLFHLPRLDAVVAVEHVPDRLCVLDIVSPTIPPLRDIVRDLGFYGKQVEVRITPDLLSWIPDETKAADSGYMVRGPFAPEGQPLMLSTMRI